MACVCRVEHDSDRAYIMGPIPDPKPDDSLPDAEDRAGEYHIDWKLPEGVTCDHCVLQVCCIPVCVQHMIVLWGYPLSLPIRVYLKEVA